MFDFGTLVQDVVRNVQNNPDLVKTGLNVAGNVLGNFATNSNRTGDAEQYAGDLQAQADVLKGGYDSQLSEIEKGVNEIFGNLDRGYQNTAGILDKTGNQYAGDIRKAGAQYASLLYPQLERLAESLSANDAEYETNLLALEREMAAQLGLGQDEFEQKLSPYTESGGQALQYLTSILGQNPNEYTPSQQNLIRDTRDDFQANLAASGLRGAGRAGVAVMNEGMGDLKARLFDQNQGRMDEAARVLNTQGYNATNRVADGIQSLNKTLADLRGKTGGTIADAKRTTGTNIANTGYNLGQDVAGKQLAAEGNIATRRSDIGTTVADLTNKYYANRGDVSGTLYQARGDAALNKASAQAAAGTGAAKTMYGANTANTTATNDTIGAITGQIASAAGEALKKAIPGQKIAQPWIDPDTGKVFPLKS